MSQDASDATIEQLDLVQRRSHLVAHVDGAAVPPWFWPALGTAVAIWIASYAGGTWWGFAGAVVMAATCGLLARSAGDAAGAMMPRLRTLPTELRRPYQVTFVTWAVVGAAVLLLANLDPGVPLPWLGVVAGATLAVSGAAITEWSRRTAQRLLDQLPPVDPR